MENRDFLEEQIEIFKKELPEAEYKFKTALEKLRDAKKAFKEAKEKLESIRAIKKDFEWQLAAFYPDHSTSERISAMQNS